jgi:hypothetical protein
MRGHAYEIKTQNPSQLTVLNNLSLKNLAMATVRVEDDVNAVGKALCDIVEKSAAKAIAEKGHFAFTIPGGYGHASIFASMDGSI